MVAARDHLAHDGALVLAIENQLGLKYFSGCREDHIGTRFSGIQGLYRDNGPVTFGRRELDLRLASAGFPARRFMLPWPDYKLPTAMVDERTLTDPDFDLAGFVGRCVGRDYGPPTPRGFLEPLVWSVLQKNGLAADLANSFLVIASRSEQSIAARAPDSSTLAWNFSSHRRPALSVVTRIVRESGGLQVRKDKISSIPLTETHDWQHTIEPVVAYVAGESLCLRMLKHAEAQNHEGFFGAGLTWIDLLRERSVLLDPSRPEAAGAWYADGDTVDLIPGNIIVEPSGKLYRFDQEWRSAERVPLIWIVLSGLFNFPPLTVQSSLFRKCSVVTIARHLLGARGLSLYQPDIDLACDCEAGFQSWVQGIPPEHFRWTDSWLQTPGIGLVADAFELSQSSPDNLAWLQAQSRPGSWSVHLDSARTVQGRGRAATTGNRAMAHERGIRRVPGAVPSFERAFRTPAQSAREI